MAKLKAPLFGIHARGTLGSSLTFSGPRRLQIAKSIPTHPDAFTPPQTRHRFLYSLGLALWAAMPPADRAAYAAGAVGLPMTAMNVFLREWLTTTPNLHLCLPIKNGSGPTAFSAGPVADNLTLYGPGWLPLAQDYALSADGVDDYATIADTTILHLAGDHWTLLFKLRVHRLQNFDIIVDKGAPVAWEWAFRQSNLNNMFYQSRTAGASHITYTAVNSIVAGEWAVWACHIDLPNVTWYKDGADVTLNPAAHGVPDYLAWPATFFRRANSVNNPSHCDLAWFVAFDRCLTLAEIQAVSSYPSL